MSLILDGTNGLSDVDGSAATPAIRGSDANTGVFFGSDVVGLSTGGTERVRVDASGNVGIGTSSPNERVTIASSGSASYVQICDSSTGTTSGDGLFLGSFNGAAELKTKENNVLTFGTNNTERARIDSSGNLLVGTTSQIRSGDRMSVVGTGAQVATFFNGTNTSGSSTISSILQSNGNNTSTYHLWGNTDAVGNWFLYGNGTTTFSSDLRLKKNIETTRDGYLEDVAKLRVVKYNWRNDEDGKPKELGLIAQEVEQVFPGLVQEDAEKISADDETRYKSIKQSVLPFILLKAIQEQQAIITALTARVEALEGAQA
jgi:trimeric autotransporter adhesin